MSQALFEEAARGRHTASSAGSEPAERVHAQVVHAMTEIGFDLSGRTPQPLSPEAVEKADVVVTMGCGDACPYIPGKRYIDWELPDPQNMSLEEVRTLREDIAGRIRDLVDDLELRQHPQA